MKHAILLSIHLVFLLAGHLSAQTIINTNIGAPTTWTQAGSPYHVTQDILVLAELTIEAGVVVWFDSVQVQVYSSIIAIGTATDSIFMHAAPTNTSQQWRGFEMRGSWAEFEYVNASQAIILLDYSSSNGLSTSQSSLFRHTYFHDNLSVIVKYAYSTFYPQIDSCKFNRITYNAIWANNASVSNSSFTRVNFPIKGTSANVQSCQFLNIVNIPIDIRGGRVENCDIRFDSNAISSNYALRLAFPSNNSDSTVIRNNHIISRYGAYLEGNTIDPFLFKNNVICSDSILITDAMLPQVSPIDMRDNCWCRTDSTSIANRMRDGTGTGTPPNINFTPFDTTCAISPVFPGDANYDQVANHIDLLPIGLFYGDVGIRRIRTDINWTPHFSFPWGTTLPNGADIKHVDTNGDRTIDDDDTLAIHLNYSMTHTSNKTWASGGIPFTFTMPTQVNPGDTLKIPLILGSVDTPAVNMYGIAYSIEYDSSLIKPNSVYMDFSSSWLGTKSVDMLTLQKDMFLESQIDVAMVRKDHMAINGFGTLAHIIIVVDDDIYKRFPDFVLSFGQALAIDNVAADLPITPYAGIAEIDSTTNSIASLLPTDIQVFPNPAQNQLQIKAQSTPIHTLVLLNTQGKRLIQVSKNKGYQYELDLASYPSGMYVLMIHTASGIYYQKVLKN